MAYKKFSTTNNAETTLFGDISASATSLSCKTGEGDLFPSTYPFRLTLEHYEGGVVTKREIIEVTNRVDDTFTVTRHSESCVQNETANPKTLTNNGLTFVDGDSIQLARTSDIETDMQDEIAAKLSKAEYQAGTKVYGSSSEGTDAYAITLDPVITAYTDGMRVYFQADVVNTGTATLNINSVGAKTIKIRHDDDLTSGDIEAGQIAEVVYSSSEDVFQMNSLSAVLPTVDIDGQTEETSVASNDTFLMYDVTAGANRKVQKSNFVPDASETAKGLAERATNAEADAGSDTTRYISAKHLDIASAPTAGTVSLVANDAEKNPWQTTYTKEKEIFVSRAGTYTVSFDLRHGSNNGPTSYCRIYVNGSAVGTERSKTNDTYTTYTENITITSDDYVQLYFKVTSESGLIRNFRIKYTVPKSGIYTNVTLS